MDLLVWPTGTFQLGAGHTDRVKTTQFYVGILTEEPMFSLEFKLKFTQTWSCRYPHLSTNTKRQSQIVHVKNEISLSFFLLLYAKMCWYFLMTFPFVCFPLISGLIRIYSK